MIASAVSQLAEAVVITDPAGVILWVNPAFTAITGYAAEEAVGAHTRLLKSGLHTPDFYADLWRTVTSGSSWSGRMTNRRKDGSTYVEEMTVTPVRAAGGEVTHFVAVKRDVSTEVRLREEGESLRAQLQQAQKMESVARLAGGVAHDFNNMLSVILGFGEMALAEVGPSSPAARSLREVIRAAERSSDLTRQLLAFARRQPVSPRVLDLDAVVSGMLRMLRKLLGEAIEVEFLPAGGLWPVFLDPSQVDQVLANLAVNARDAVGGRGRVDIATANRSWSLGDADRPAGAPPGEYVELTVSDDGCGMDPVTLSHVFEPFFTTKKEGKGTGLGLATVYGIVRQNGGFIDVRSAPGDGTTFRILLPRHVAAESPGSAAAEPEAPRGGSETLLLVEDEAPILEVGRAMLEGLGYTVHAARTASEALETTRAGSPAIHLLVTDVVMPEMSGRELADRIAPGHPGMRTLYMSGYTADVIAPHGVLEPGVHFLQKPFTVRDLARGVRKALDG
ncbi:MAG: PAS domain S-box protein [Planctomycetaceae bacterium]|nr:ATP-binding protein [Planctomycetota bacterium]NUN52779.1 PAS domain S-box protein [Planctomycetaceae bacterium]